MNKNPRMTSLDHINFTVQDFSESAAWYRSESAENLHRIYHFGLRIHEREKWERTLNEANLPTCFGSPRKYPHSISWYITDPTGHII